MLALRRLLPVSRSFHTSSSALRKAKAPVEEEADMDDLFDDSTEVVETSGDRSVARAQLSQEIFRRTPNLKVGTLRKVVQLSDTPEDLEQLGQVLREWRVSGQRVTNQTAEELVGRCIKLGRPDLAQTYASDRLQFGLPPLRPNTQARLDKSL